MANAARLDILGFVSPHVTGKTHVTFLFFFLPGKPHLFRIDDDHKIARIHVWRENSLLFATQQIRCFYSDLSQHLVLGVDDPPLPRDFAGFGRKRFHREKEHGNYERHNSMSTHRQAHETHESDGTDESIAEMLAGQLAFARLILWPCRIRLPQRPQSPRGGTKIFRNGISRSSARRNWPSRRTCVVVW